MAGVEAAASRVLQVGLRRLQPEPGRRRGSLGGLERRGQLQRSARRLLAASAAVVRRRREGRRRQHRQHRRHPHHLHLPAAAAPHTMLLALIVLQHNTQLLQHNTHMLISFKNKI